MQQVQNEERINNLADQITRAMNGAKMIQITKPETKEGELYATHQGSIIFLGCSLKIYQLNNGKRVIDEDGIKDILDLSDLDISN